MILIFSKFRDFRRVVYMRKGPQFREEGLRIIIFTAAYFILDGVSLTIRRLEEHLKAIGASWRIITCVPDHIPRDQCRHVIDVPGIDIPLSHAGEGYKLPSGLSDGVLEEIEAFNPSVCHFTVPDIVSIEGITWCRQNNIPYMATWHSNYVDYLKYYNIEWTMKPIIMYYLKNFYGRIRRVLVPTPFIKDKLEREHMNLGRDKFRVWGRGVDLERFNPSRRSLEFRRDRGIGDEDVVIMWVGRLVPEKSPDIWVSALERLVNEGHSFHALVVGHGSFERHINLPNTTFTGWLAGLELAEAYASSDILLFPSGVETFGNVTLEALASGVPSVVEEKCGGHLVKSGVNGFTCPRDDHESFYQAVSKLVTDHTLRRKMSKAARDGAWEWEHTKIMHQMVGHYKKAIADLEMEGYEVEDEKEHNRHKNILKCVDVDWETEDEEVGHSKMIQRCTSEKEEEEDESNEEKKGGYHHPPVPEISTRKRYVSSGYIKFPKPDSFYERMGHRFSLFFYSGLYYLFCVSSIISMFSSSKPPPSPSSSPRGSPRHSVQSNSLCSWSNVANYCAHPVLATMGKLKELIEFLFISLSSISLSCISSSFSSCVTWQLGCIYAFWDMIFSRCHCPSLMSDRGEWEEVSFQGKVVKVLYYTGFSMAYAVVGFISLIILGIIKAPPLPTHL